MSTVGIVDNTLQDAQQCLWGGQMGPSDFAQILGRLDNAGYHSLEVFGRSAFRAALLGKRDPWDTLQFIAERVEKTPLQAYVNGLFLAGDEPYPWDIVERFVFKLAEKGIRIFRLIDPLNDTQNLELPISLVKETGGHAQAAVIYSKSQGLKADYFVSLAKKLSDLGADSLCIMDDAGALTPQTISHLVSAIKEKVALPINLHVHYNGGMGIGVCLSAADVGIDLIDGASAPLAFGTSLPPVETLLFCLHDGGFDTGIDQSGLFVITEYFEEMRKERAFERGLTRISNLHAFEHQIPGLLLEEIEQRMRDKGMEDCLLPALEEIDRIRAELGYPTLEHPLGQIIAEQALINLQGEQRYCRVTEGVANYLRGLYGKPPGPVERGRFKSITGAAAALKGRPVQHLPYRWEKTVRELAHLTDREEDALSYLMYPELALNLLKSGEAAQPGLAEDVNREEIIEDAIQGEESNVIIGEIRELLNCLEGSGVTELSLESGEHKIHIKRSFNEPAKKILPEQGAMEGYPAPASDSFPAVKKSSATARERPAASLKEIKQGNLIPIIAPIVGRFYRSQSPESPPFVELGTRVSSGDTLCIVEAMKVMNEVESEVDGIVVEILVENGKPVEYGQTIMLIAQEVAG